MPEVHMLGALIRDFKNEEKFKSIHRANTEEKPRIQALPLTGIFETLVEISHLPTRALDLVVPRKSQEKQK